MTRQLSILALALPLALSSGMVHAKGCLKGAAVGGIAGHVAGGHGVVGAAAGCAIEHHRETKQQKDAAKQAAQAQAGAGATPAAQPQPSPSPSDK